MKKMIKLIAAGVLLLLCVIVFFVLKNRKFTGVAEVKTLEVKNSVEYIMSDKHLISIGKEGSEAVGADGTKLWNFTYSGMSNPIAAFSGDMTVLADVGAKRYYLSEGDGIAKPFSVPFPVQSICVASQGVTAVLMNDVEKDYLNLYDKNGQLLSSICTVVSRDGFPVSMTLSPNGKKLITSYMKVEDDDLLTTLTFYNFSEVGKNYERNLVGQVQYPGSVVPRILFLDGEHVIAAGEKNLEFFSMRELPTSLAKIDLEDNIKSISTGAYFCVVMEDKEGHETLLAYDGAGNVCLKTEIKGPYAGLHTAGKDIVLFTYSGCDFYQIGEGHLLSARFTNGVKKVLATGGNRYFLIEEKAVKVIKLVK